MLISRSILGVSSLLIFLAGSLTSCRVGEPLQVDDLRTQLAVAESFGTGSPEATRDGWLGDFGDEELVEIVDEAVAGNPDLAVAAAQVDRAAAIARQAGASLSPAVSLGAGGYTSDSDLGRSTQGGASLDFAWELDLWGRVRSQVSAAENQYLATELTYEYAKQSLAAQVAKSWFFCIETHLQVQIAQSAVDIYEQTQKITQGMYDLDAIPLSDVQLAEADLASSNEALREAMGADQQARRALELLAGRYPSAEIEVTTDFVAVPPDIPVGLPSELLERRADVVAAERRVAAAFENVRVAQAARLPRVAITASAGTTSDSFREMSNPANAFWNLGSNLLAPLFDGGYLKSEQDIATAEQKAAVAEYRSVGLKAFGEVENALSNEKFLAEREEFLTEALTKNQQVWELANKRYEAGDIDLLSVLQLQKRVLNARVALVHLHALRLAERVNLHLSLGGNFESPDSQPEE